MTGIDKWEAIFCSTVPLKEQTDYTTDKIYSPLLNGSISEKEAKREPFLEIKKDNCSTGEF